MHDTHSRISRLKREKEPNIESRAPNGQSILHQKREIKYAGNIKIKNDKNITPAFEKKTAFTPSILDLRKRYKSYTEPYRLNSLMSPTKSQFITKTTVGIKLRAINLADITIGSNAHSRFIAKTDNSANNPSTKNLILIALIGPGEDFFDRRITFTQS